MNIESEPEVAASPPEKPQTIVARKIDEARARYTRELTMLMRMADVINSLPEDIAAKCCIYNDYLDFNQLSREESLTVIKALNAGDWTKTPNLYDSERPAIDYNAEINGVKVRLWAAAPPDSCRVIEVEEEVPATKIVRRKLICSGPEV